MAMATSFNSLCGAKCFTELNTFVNKATTRLESQSFAYNSLKDITIPQKPITEYSVEFSDIVESYCIGFVDMVNSSKISSSLRDVDRCKYYGIFLNSMSKILKSFGAEVIKNVGDSLLYYFPTIESKMDPFISCVEAGLVLTEAREIVNVSLKKENLPEISYRVSSDYGKVVVMRSNTSNCIDLLGPPVNMCVKINHKAEKNQLVLGGDLYNIVKDSKDYGFKLISDFSLGFKLSYPVYHVKRKNPTCPIYY